MKKVMLIGAIVLLLIGAVALFLVMRNRADATRTNELLAQWQAAGGALTLAELKPEPIPDDRNAAVLYEQAFAFIDDWTEAQYGAVSELVLDDVGLRTLLDSKPAVELALQAGRRTECWWDSARFDDPIQGNAPHLRQSRRLARLLCFAAHHALINNQPDRAIELLHATRLLSKHMGNEPGLMGALVARSIDILALLQFEADFADRELPPDTSPFEKSVQTEALNRWAILSEGSLAISLVIDHYEQRRIRLKYHRDIQFGLQSCLDGLHVFEGNNQAELDAADWAAAERTPLISTLFLPGWAKFIGYLQRVDRLQLAAQTAITLRRYRDEYGAYPETWDMPTDPLSGQPMIYRRTDAGFEITSSLEDDESPLLWQWQ